MQNVSFQSVDEFLEFLPEDERWVAEKLRNLVLDTLPEIDERLSFNVPYYRLKKDICFIWPASVLWGKHKSYTGVRLGMTSGYLLQDETQYFNLGNRKQVTYRDFIRLNEIETELLKTFLFEAAMLDEQNALNKIKTKKKRIS